jgi:hypothetical protein
MPDEVTVIRIGTHIESNGGTVLACKPGAYPNTTVVLCLLPTNHITPFVIHTYMEKSGACSQGDYEITIQDAVERYNARGY